MGILSKLFGKKSIETLKEFDAELTKFQKKIGYEMIALIGTAGRLKGLPLIYAYAAEDDTSLKKYSARLNEIINPINVITEGRKVDELSLLFEGNILILKPITPEIAFFAITQITSDITSIQQWIDKRISILEKIFQEK